MLSTYPLQMTAMERDTIFYMLDRNSPQEREFISGVVVGGGGENLVIQFARSWMGIAVGEKVPLHYKSHGQFLSREHLVTRVTEDEDGTRLKLEPIGHEPQLKDMRSSERIPTIHETMLARIGRESDCVVLDISTSGVAIMGGGHYSRGEVVEFEMWVRDTQYLGTVTICSTIEVRPGRFRYGLKCNEDAEGQNLRGSLPQLWVALQIKFLEIMSV
jgi:hypothetical protein